ncbi:hypothetical protein B484DRAFT_200000 [Ochromonadaceae sp. CCMP2298]|nr:hypothetical protein B484DRAFT_200000 [Ochromonadaceae sp. CCMP2298]
MQVQEVQVQGVQGVQGVRGVQGVQGQERQGEEGVQVQVQGQERQGAQVQVQVPPYVLWALSLACALLLLFSARSLHVPAPIEARTLSTLPAYVSPSVAPAPILPYMSLAELVAESPFEQAHMRETGEQLAPQGQGEVGQRGQGGLSGKVGQGGKVANVVRNKHTRSALRIVLGPLVRLLLLPLDLLQAAVDLAGAAVSGLRRFLLHNRQ